MTCWRSIICVLILVLGDPAAAQNQTDDLTIAGGFFPERWGDPFSSTSISRQPLWSAIFDPLTLVTTDGILMPWLATAWVQTRPTVWRITLRPGVVFSNGERFDASGVVAAVDYVTSLQGRSTPVGRELDVIATAIVINPYTVDIVTTRPDALLPYKLSLVRPLEPAKWAVESPDEYFTSPPGTGPYVVGDIGPTESTLKAASNSWRSAPAETIRLLALVDASARQAALLTGQADISLGAVSPDEFDAVQATGGRVFVDRIPAVVALAFNTVKDTPFRDERVREAVIHAVDRRAIVDILLGGETMVASQPAPRSAFGYNDTLRPRPFDPERAKRLLRVAGYTDGFEAVMELPGGTVLYVDVFQKVASDLANVGINLEVRPVPQPAFLELIQTGAWNGHAMAIPFFTPVSDGLYAMRQNSCLWHAPYYCDEEAVPLIEQALAEAGLDRRERLTRAVMARAHAQAQALFLYETVSFIGLGPRVKNFRADFGFIRYEAMAVEGAAED